MQVTVTTTRECCELQDLKPLNGKDGPKRGRIPIYMFCQHCGRHHKMETYTDAAGSRDWRYEPQPWPPVD